MLSTEADALKEAGNNAFREGRFGEAVEQFSAAIALTGTSHTLFSNRSGALAALGRYSEALADAERAISLSPEWAKGYSRKGAALYGMGRYDEALSTYEAGLATDPSNAQIAQAAADVRRKLTAARALLEAAGTGAVGVVQACLRDGIAPDSVATPDGSTPLLVAAAAGHAEVVQTLLGAGADRAWVNRAGETALSLARHSGHADVLTLLAGPEPAAVAGIDASAEASAAVATGAKSASTSFWGAAKGLAERSRQMAEKTAAQVSLKASAAQKDLQRAREDRERAAEAARKAADEKAAAAATEAEAHARAEALARAEGERVAAEAVAAEEAEKAEQLRVEQRQRAEFAESYKQHGNAAFQGARYAEAVRLYSQALECDSSSAVLYSNRSGALAASGSFASALSDAERCIALEPKWAKGHMRKATCLHGLKRYLAAVQAYEDALTFEPGAEAVILGRRQSSFALMMEED